MNSFFRELVNHHYCYLCDNMLESRFMPYKYYSEQPNFEGSPVSHLRIHHVQQYEEIFAWDRCLCLDCGRFADAAHECDRALAFHAGNYRMTLRRPDDQLVQWPPFLVDWDARKVYATADAVVNKLHTLIGVEITGATRILDVFKAGSIGSGTAVASSDVDIFVLASGEYDRDPAFSRTCKQFIIERFPEMTQVVRACRKDFCQISGELDGVVVELTFVFDAEHVQKELLSVARVAELQRTMGPELFGKFLTGKCFITQFTRDFKAKYGKRKIVLEFLERLKALGELVPSLSAAFQKLGEEQNDNALLAAAREVQKCTFSQ